MGSLERALVLAVAVALFAVAALTWRDPAKPVVEPLAPVASRPARPASGSAAPSPAPPPRPEGRPRKWLVDGIAQFEIWFGQLDQRTGWLDDCCPGILTLLACFACSSARLLDRGLAKPRVDRLSMHRPQRQEMRDTELGAALCQREEAILGHRDLLVLIDDAELI